VKRATLRRPFLLLCAAPFLCVAAQAQSPISLEATAGIGSGVGGRASRYRTGPSVDALLAIRLRTLSRSGIVIAVAAGAQGAPARDEICILTPNNKCLPNFPIIASLGPLAGWESSQGSLRLLGGASLFKANDGNRSFGISGRIDAAVPRPVHVAPVISLRLGILPRFQGDLIGLLSIGAGLRIQ
jgi:hypothetical protein